MSSVVLISGAPGVGKTTIAARLAAQSPRGVHILSDIFYGFPAHPIPPHRSEAHEQNEGVIAAMVRAAIAFAERDHEVFVDGIVGPWFMPVVLDESRRTSAPVHYVILAAAVATAIERLAGRDKQRVDVAIVEQMHHEFTSATAYRHHVVRTNGLAIEELTRVIRQRLGAGSFIIPRCGSEVRPARVPEEIGEVRALFEEYSRSLGVDLCFQDFSAELADLPGEYVPPGGRLLVASAGGGLVGCVAVRRLDTSICEMKRLYVQPTARGAGVGRGLADAAIGFAKDAGYELMRLDTLAAMTEAHALYRKLGFRETTAYRHNPIADATFMQLKLSDEA